jgi:hypothetical protein
MRHQRNRLRRLRWRLWRGRLPTCIPRRNFHEHSKLPSEPLRDNRAVQGASPGDAVMAIKVPYIGRG